MITAGIAAVLVTWCAGRPRAAERGRAISFEAVQGVVSPISSNVYLHRLDTSHGLDLLLYGHVTNEARADARASGGSTVSSEELAPSCFMGASIPWDCTSRSSWLGLAIFLMIWGIALCSRSWHALFLGVGMLVLAVRASVIHPRPLSRKIGAGDADDADDASEAIYNAGTAPRQRYQGLTQGWCASERFVVPCSGRRPPVPRWHLRDSRFLPHEHGTGLLFWPDCVQPARYRPLGPQLQVCRLPRLVGWRPPASVQPKAQAVRKVRERRGDQQLPAPGSGGAGLHRLPRWPPEGGDAVL